MENELKINDDIKKLKLDILKKILSKIGYSTLIYGTKNFHMIIDLRIPTYNSVLF